MDTATDAPDLTQAETFRHWTPVSLRFSDEDSMGHINNVAYAAYVEQARVAFIDAFLKSQGGGDIDYILVHVHIDFIGAGLVHQPCSGDMRPLFRAGSSAAPVDGSADIGE